MATRILPHVLTILDRLAEAVTVQGPDGALVYANEAAARQLGFDRSEELLAAAPEAFMRRYEVLDEHGRALDVERLPGRRVLAGETAEPLIVQHVDRASGRRRFTLTKASPILAADGSVLFAVNVIEEVTQLVRAQQEQRRMAQASRALGSSLDPALTIEKVAWALVPEVADCAAVHLPDRDGDLELAAFAHADHQRLGDPPPLAPPELGAVRQDEHRIDVPIAFGGDVLGMLVLGSATSGRRFDERDLALAEDLGRRAGTAIEHARRHESRVRIASTLQRSLLPPRLPDVPGLSLAARFRSAEAGTEVGGDFYDVFPVDGAWFAVMGDVTGKGPAAAAVTGLARYTMRTAAMYETSPSAVLDRLNATLLGEQRQCSAVCARLEPVADGWHVVVACAGHPPPFVLHRGRPPRQLGRPGTLGGAFREGRATDEAATLTTGDTLLFYTDGVTDARGPEGRFELDRLVALLGGVSGASADAVAGTIDAALREFQVGPQRDDVAILAVEIAD